MLDNIKLYILDKENFEKNLSINHNIDLHVPYNVFTSELAEYPKVGRLLNLEVRISPKEATVKGSIHKFLNSYLDGEEHNHNDFDIRDLKFALEELINSLDIHPERTSITNLEFGFNIEVDEDPKTIIMHDLQMFNFRDHNRKDNFSGRGDYKEFQITDYIVKVYNKSKQYGLDKNILRIELKFTNARVLNRLGIFNLNDINKTETLKLLFNFFMETFNKLHIVDDFSECKNIPVKVKNRLHILTNPNFWNKARSSRMKETLKREYNRLIKKYNLDRKKGVLGEKIQSKYTEMMRLTNSY